MAQKKSDEELSSAFVKFLADLAKKNAAAKSKELFTKWSAQTSDSPSRLAALHELSQSTADRVVSVVVSEESRVKKSIASIAKAEKNDPYKELITGIFHQLQTIYYNSTKINPKLFGNNEIQTEFIVEIDEIINKVKTDPIFKDPVLVKSKVTDDLLKYANKIKTELEQRITFKNKLKDTVKSKIDLGFEKGGILDRANPVLGAILRGFKSLKGQKGPNSYIQNAEKQARTAEFQAPIDAAAAAKDERKNRAAQLRASRTASRIQNEPPTNTYDTPTDDDKGISPILTAEGKSQPAATSDGSSSVAAVDGLSATVAESLDNSARPAATSGGSSSVAAVGGLSATVAESLDNSGCCAEIVKILSHHTSLLEKIAGVNTQMLKFQQDKMAKDAISAEESRLETQDASQGANGLSPTATKDSEEGGGLLGTLLNFLPFFRGGKIFGRAAQLGGRAVGLFSKLSQIGGGKGVRGLLPTASRLAGPAVAMTTAGVIASGAGTEIAQTASKELGEEAAKRAASKATAEVGTVVAKKSGKGIITSVIKRIVPKTIAKMFGKSIPLVGAVIGGMFALGKLIKGDFVGAGLEAASGLAGPITAIPLTIISMARDVYREVFDINPETDPQVGERMGEIKNQVTEAANEELTRLTGKGVNDAKTSPDASAGTEPSPSSPSATEATPTSSPASATPDAPAATPSDGAQPSEDQPKDQPPAKSPGFFSSLAKGALSAGRALIASRSLYNNNVRGTATKTPSITNLDDTKKMIIRHEGIRYRPYKDSLGLWTVGVGHLIGNGRNLPPDMNRDFSHDEVMSMFNEDYDHHEKAAMQIPGYSRMNATGKAALIDLTFNMGPAWHKKFPKTVKALAVGDVEGAASGLENSLWYRQVGNRAPEIVSMIRAGASPNVAASTEAAGATPTQAAPAPAPATVGETTGTGASAPSAPSAAPAGDITSQGRASLSANIVRPSVPMGGGTGGGGNVTNIMQGGTTIAGGGSGGSASTPIPAPIDREPTIRRILDGALT